jgi:hypothetical protein
MIYDYIERAYGKRFWSGQRVKFEEARDKRDTLSREGTVKDPDPSYGLHYVMVQFDGEKWPLPCHPGSLV